MASFITQINFTCLNNVQFLALVLTCEIKKLRQRVLENLAFSPKARFCFSLVVVVVVSVLLNWSD